MPLIPPDTDEAAHRVQVDAWRRLGAAKRVALAAEMSEATRSVAAAGVRHRHPHYTDAEVRLAVIRLTLGDELFHEAYPGEHIAP